MEKIKTQSDTAGTITLWLLVWLALTWLLEQVRQGFVVNWINTKWLAFLLVISGTIYLLSRFKQYE